MNESFMHSK